MPARESGFVRYILAIVAGPLLWFAHLGAVYGWTAVHCARRDAGGVLAGAGTLRLAIGLITVVALAAAAVVVIAALRRHARSADAATRFAAIVTALAGGLAAVAIAWGGLPAIVVAHPCGP